MGVIQNPIIPGFNPDPSILRVGDDFYIAVSTFEWFPGVLIYHSKDLANWELAAAPLNRVSQLNMAGNPSSGGIWAPCLSYDDGLFYLIYTDVKSWADGPFKDAHNYLVTAKDVRDDWSEPVYMNSSGFDPSLFHDDDGKKWFVNMRWNYRPNVNPFDGILLQEYDPEQKKLVGPIKNIFKGTELELTEAPHIYKRNGYYYLLTAEGGTTYKHAVTIARSKTIDGPYEVHPSNPILTSWNNPDLRIQKSGHGSFCEGKDGYWYLAHLGGRALGETDALRRLWESGKDLNGNEIRGVCPLGRETSLQKYEWKDDDWIYHVSGGNEPLDSVEIEGVEVKPRKKDYLDSFDIPKLPLYYQSLRVPMSNFASLEDRKGYLRLYGKESLNSRFNQALVARRKQSFVITAETALEYKPDDYQQMAGLLVKYNENNQFYLRVTFNEQTGKRSIGIMHFDQWSCHMPLGENEIPVEDNVTSIKLKADIDHGELRFSYCLEGDKFIPMDGVFDASILSDEFANPMGFTGTFVGMACQDMSGRNMHCDFEYFRYTERD